MRLLEDLSSGKYNIVLFGILFIFMFHQYWCTSRSTRQSWSKHTKEPMADVSVDIKEAVKQVYLADVEAIRNLSEVATKLQKEGLKIPGNLTVDGSIKSQTVDELNTKINNLNTNLTNNINTSNSNLSNNITSLQSQINSINSTLSNCIKNSDKIRITNQGTGNHEGGSKKWMGLCGHGDCGMLNVVFSDQQERVNFKIEKI